MRDLEAELMKSSRQYARLRRLHNPNQIFQDIKKPASPGVDLFVKPMRSQIVRVDHESCAIELEPSQEWLSDRPFFCGDMPLHIIHAEADCLWVQSLEAVCVGAFVSQTKCRGTKNELAKAFLDAWKEKWERHRDVPNDRWSNIIGFARCHLPHLQMEWPSLDPIALSRCIDGKKRTTSGGLDGVSLVDLKGLPPAALQIFCDMFDEAETSGIWPRQLLEGRVACVAKCAEPTDVMDFRPISILGLLYRVWGTHHARRAIRALESVLPDTLYGSRPAHFAGQVWSQMLWVIEDSHANDIPLAGLVADLQKAFNFLPRLVVFESAALLGIPFKVLTAWAGAVAGLRRRFQIRDCLTDAASSTTGFAEGDALSCVAMLIVDILFHGWYSCFFPLCQPISYVDDWQVLSTQPEAMSETFRCMSDFTDAMDLLIDPRKTFTWSTTAAGRASLRDQGFKTVHCCKSLGAHIQITRQHTNMTQVERIQSLGELWPRLKLSASPYQQKVRAIKQAAWPKGLHAIAGTSVGAHHYQSLRSGAVRGLNADSAGCNAHLHLLCSDSCLDPQAWAIWHTLRFVRDCGIDQVVIEALRDLCHGDSALPANGITSTLLSRIQTLAWHVDVEGNLVDAFGQFSLFDTSPEELLWRVEWAWTQVVAAEVSHRPGLADFAVVDVPATRLWLRRLNASDQALARRMLDGTHITQDSKQYCQEADTDLCPYCDCSDSRFHRFWQCAQHQSCRVHVSAEVWNLIPTLPECVTSYGWSLLPTTSQEWYQYLAAIEVVPVPILGLGKECLHVFTDGSCFNPQFGPARFASWAVVLASGFGRCHSEILESGPLPGIRQTSMRAEIYAVHRALRLALANNADMMIWCDCAAVVRKLHKLLQGGEVRRNSPNSDLWRTIFHDIQHLRTQVGITKVAAHRKIESAASALEEWCFRHNHFSDHAACRANLLRPPMFWKLLDRHVHACEVVGQWNAEIHQVLLAVSRAVVQGGAMECPEPEVMPPTEVPVWKPLPPLQVPHLATRWYGDDVVRSILSWFWSALFSFEEEVRWISHFQLFIDYTASSGEVGPVHFDTWRNGSTVECQGLRNSGFKERTRWFIKVLKESIRHLHIDLAYKYCCPASSMLAMHTGCIALPWPRWRLDLVDKYLFKFSCSAFRRQSKALDTIPVAPRLDEFPRLFVSLC